MQMRGRRPWIRAKQIQGKEDYPSDRGRKSKATSGRGDRARLDSVKRGKYLSRPLGGENTLIRQCTTKDIFIGTPSANDVPRELRGLKGPTLKHRLQMMGWPTI
jgi:hypothetical protein